MMLDKRLLIKSAVHGVKCAIVAFVLISAVILAVTWVGTLIALYGIYTWAALLFVIFWALGTIGSYLEQNKEKKKDEE